jgi:hypothetical protein
LEQFGLLGGQTLSHVPQLNVSVFKSTSQPFTSALSSQSAKPELHRISHVPAPQVGVPLAVLHTVPQPPQLLVELVSASQPSSGWLLQSPNPVLHTGWHSPPTQLVLPFWLVHAVPQAPQSVLLTATLTHSWLQQSKPVGQFVDDEQPGTQEAVAGSHSLPGGHGLLASQPVHWCVPRSQVSAPPSLPQSALSPQPSAQFCPLQ